MADSELLFCGENRRTELTRLIRAYDDVAAVAEAVTRSGAPTTPVHRVVLVHAERGLGKTRLVMELYRHLSEQRDSGHYWPDDYEKRRGQVSIMPPAEACNYNAILPYLWWGIQIPDMPNPGNTLLSSLEDLIPHLVSMRIAHQRRMSGRSAIAELTAAGTDIAIELADASFQIGSEAIGFGIVKRVGEAIWRIGGIVNKQVKQRRSAQAQVNEYIATVTDELLADLGRLLNPNSRDFAHCPAVIFLDDAQFADRDQPMAAFVERLIARSASERWPVLIVLSHWSRPLKDTHDRNGKLRSRSRIADVLNHAVERTGRDIGKYAKQPGGLLAREHLVTLDLSEPVDDLEPALARQFPGIAAQTRREIVAKSGGNPRKLEQIVARMWERPRWFVAHDRNLDLTEDGRQAVNNLSDLEIEHIVYERLRDTPNGVRRSLALSSLLGSRFVVDCADRLAGKLLNEQAREHLEAAETSYRFLKDACRKRSNDIALFSEALFFDAACEYRANARADFADWPPETQLWKTLDEFLDSFVQNPDHFEDWTDDDKVLALRFAFDRMSINGSQYAGLALAWTVAIENRRSNYEGASQAAQAFIAGFGT